jgi:hypothetical protein
VIAIALFALAGCSASSGPAGSAVGENGGSGNGGNGGTLPTTGGTAGTIPGGGSGGSSPCTDTTGTSISGYAYDPAGKVPLYNVLVYVPVDPAMLPPITEGASCEKCAGREARAYAAALTDATGHFVLQDTPAGANVPLVIEAGKWRRQTTIPNVTRCQENVLEDPELTRLPRNQSEGHLPKIAMVTGHSDAVECLLRKIGISDEEFTTDAGSGRVNMFVGCIHDESGEYGANKFAAELGGADFPHAVAELYPDPEKLDSYDMLVLSCEGHGCTEEKDGFYDNLKAYGDKGGRIFLDHMHFNWINHSDNEWEGSADIAGTGTDLPPVQVVNIDTSFPKGNSFADWLVSVEASPTRGELTIYEGQFSIRAAVPPKSQRWVYLDSHPLEPGESTVEYLTINTPVELAETDPDNQCGRIVYTDLHVSAGPVSDSSNQNTPFPGGCSATDLSGQEKALEFMLFDLGGCVQREDREPEPPVVVR